MLTLPTYVLITPARNEAELIGLTLKAVAAQTVRPLKWVIVSDGSTDSTDEIVAKYASEHPWIELLRMPARQERHFAGKVHAFRAGYARLAGLPYDVIGNLDGDTSFDPDFFAFLLGKLAEDPKLGVVGGQLVDASSGQNAHFENTSSDYVSGPCQLFRRDCWEAIGGYQPMKSGGVDLVAILSARMKGWKVQAFT
jgi:poly-beta-1,6-N-acetyl-D-glucosamine synthase